MALQKAPAKDADIRSGMRMDLDGVDGFGWTVHDIQGDTVIFTRKVGDTFQQVTRDREEVNELYERNSSLKKRRGRFDDLLKNPLTRFGDRLNQLPTLGEIKFNKIATDSEGGGKIYIAAERAGIPVTKTWIDADLLNKVANTISPLPDDLKAVAEKIGVDVKDLGLLTERVRPKEKKEKTPPTPEKPLTPAAEVAISEPTIEPTAAASPAETTTTGPSEQPSTIEATAARIDALKGARATETVLAGRGEPGTQDSTIRQTRETLRGKNATVREVEQTPEYQQRFNENAVRAFILNAPKDVLARYDLNAPPTADGRLTIINTTIPSQPVTVMMPEIKSVVRSETIAQLKIEFPDHPKFSTVSVPPPTPVAPPAKPQSARKGRQAPQGIFGKITAAASAPFAGLRREIAIATTELAAQIDVLHKNLDQISQQREAAVRKLNDLQWQEMEAQRTGNLGQVAAIQTERSNTQEEIKRLDLNSVQTLRRIGSKEQNQTQLGQIEEQAEGDVVTPQIAAQIQDLSPKPAGTALPARPTGGPAPSANEPLRVRQPGEALTGAGSSSAPGLMAGRAMALDQAKQMARVRKIVAGAVGAAVAPAMLEPSTLSDTQTDMLADRPLSDNNQQSLGEFSPFYKQEPETDEEDVTPSLAQSQSDFAQKMRTQRQTAAQLQPATRQGEEQAEQGMDAEPGVGQPSPQEAGMETGGPTEEEAAEAEEENASREQASAEEMERLKNEARLKVEKQRGTLKQQAQAKEMQRIMKLRKEKHLKDLYRFFNGADAAHGSVDGLGLLMTLVVMDIQFVNKITFKNPKIPPTSFPVEDCVLCSVHCLIGAASCVAVTIPIVIFVGPMLGWIGVLFRAWSVIRNLYQSIFG